MVIYIYINEKHNLIKRFKLYSHNIVLYKWKNYYLNNFFEKKKTIIK